LSIHIPLNASTKNFIGENYLSLIKPGAYLINLSRGKIVNEQVLYDLLVKENGLRGAALDVHEQEGDGKISPLASLPNVILTPHIGANTVDSQYEIGQRIINHVREFRN